MSDEKKNTNLQKYGSFELEAAEQEAEESKAATQGDFMKIEEGRNIVRFLPPPIGKTTPFRVVYRHYIDVPGQKTRTVLTCPRMERKQDCPICNESDRLKRSGNPADRDHAFKMSPTRRVMANVINRGAPQKGPVIIEFGKGIHDKLLKIRQDRTSGGDFTDPKDGFDIIIEREGTGPTDTKYDTSAARLNSPLGDLTWLDKQFDLDQHAIIKGPDEIEAMLAGEAPRRRGAEQPRSRQQETAPRGRSVQDDIEDADVVEVGPRSSGAEKA